MSAAHAALEARAAEVDALRGVVSQAEDALVTSLRDSSARNDTLAILAKRESEAEVLRSRIDSALGELDYVLHSVSWKVTRPLRALRHRIGKSRA
jgi:hypothetical protein